MPVPIRVAVIRRLEEYRQSNLPAFAGKAVKASEGSKYFKIYTEDSASCRSVVLFIDKADGKTYRPASWMRPSKMFLGFIDETWKLLPGRMLP